MRIRKLITFALFMHNGGPAPDLRMPALWVSKIHLIEGNVLIFQVVGWRSLMTAIHFTDCWSATLVFRNLNVLVDVAQHVIELGHVDDNIFVLAAGACSLLTILGSGTWGPMRRERVGLLLLDVDEGGACEPLSVILPELASVPHSSLIKF